MKISPARLAAYEVLSKIDRERAYSSVLLPAYEARLEPVDRGLCHEIVLGVLRRRNLLDRYIDELANHKKLDPEVRRILQIAVYQLIFLDKVPAHAVLNDAVNLTQKAKKTSAKGFVNAILRRFTRERPELGFKDETERVSVETSHPRWLIERWTRQFGPDEAAKLAEANNTNLPPAFRFTARTSDAVRTSLENKDLASEGNYLRELAANGKIYFQDTGSQLVGAAAAVREGERFLDVCAAPGSKITQVAAAAPGALLVGGDLHLHRARTLRASAVNQGAGAVSVLQYDAEQALPFAEESFDVVLVDAPCTGTGTIRHNPEIRYFLEESDPLVLSHKQLRILSGASKLVKRGGRLIYSTCSLEREENEGVIERFVEDHRGFQKITPEVPREYITHEGFGRTLPQRDGMDGFFIAAFEKK